jgi:hypothetical protein
MTDATPDAILAHVQARLDAAAGYSAKPLSWTELHDLASTVARARVALFPLREALIRGTPARNLVAIAALR